MVNRKPLILTYTFIHTLTHVLSIIYYDIFEVILSKPVLELMRIENASFGHHLGHHLRSAAVIYQILIVCLLMKNRPIFPFIEHLEKILFSII